MRCCQSDPPHDKLVSGKPGAVQEPTRLTKPYCKMFHGVSSFWRRQTAFLNVLQSGAYANSPIFHQPCDTTASRARLYKSTVYILLPSIPGQDERLQVAEFYSAR